MAKELASEKILPAPSPTPGPPLTDANGDEVHIPSLDELPGAFVPGPAILPPTVRAAHRPDGTPTEDGLPGTSVPGPRIGPASR